ncbi:osmoprotectant transport system permease protein [Paracoccus solventivorans]|uniref:Osmoprotectant transport system permease protein n=1 Tax=Paracoccus solventivorans TaxID=53463 RepID=A0A1M7DXU4_9RHOB|nr:ABC transporter permease [Paracoccus solventivorans]SHL84322.1 osmoprotectant transport system permease protein [Paracoccus solventivorans]
MIGRAALAAAALLLAAFLISPDSFAPLLEPLTRRGAPAVYTQTSLWSLTVSHLALVAGAIAASAVIAVGLGVLVTRDSGRDFLPLARMVTAVGQTFPPVAVLALAVPVLGFGDWPTLLALFLYGLLPIFENTLAGLTTLPPQVVEAARGMGMTPAQRLWRVELPLALPVILSGVRLSAVIALSTAAIGSTVAAHTLGEVIIAGLLSSNAAFVVQGGAVIATLALLIDAGFRAAESAARSRAGF